MQKKVLLLLFPLFSLMASEKMPASEKAFLEKEENKVITNQETTAFFKENVVKTPAFIKEEPKQEESSIDLKEIFLAAPFIYALLLMMSVGAVVIWVFSLLTFKEKNFLPEDFSKKLRQLILDKKDKESKQLCEKESNLLAKMLSVGISTKNLGAQVMIESMKAEGRRASGSFWQRLTLLNDIVVIAPMLGLLGTVMGMFYAFYDINRSVESVNALFDGLGIAVGTTVFGLFVAIAAMIFSTTLKYRLTRLVGSVEKEALSQAMLMLASNINLEEKVANLQKSPQPKARKTLNVNE